MCADLYSIKHLLTEWEGQMGIYLAQAYNIHALSPYTRTEGHIFSHPVQPNLVNKYFIILLIWRQNCFVFQYARLYTFVIKLYSFTWSCSHQCLPPWYGCFVKNGFENKVRMGL